MNSKSGMSTISWIFFSLGLFLLYNFYIASNKAVSVEISPAALVAEIRKDNVASLSFTQGSLHITGNLNSVTGKNAPFSADVVSTLQLDEIRKLADEKNISYEVKPVPNTIIWQIIQMAIWVVLLFALFAYMGKKQTQQFNGFAKTKSKKDLNNPRDRKTFADVAGCDEAKQELMDVVDYLKNPRGLSSLGGKISKGVLMVGVPGTGKTLLARAVAGEAGANFFSANGADFVEMFVGVGASRIRSLFEEARKAAPSIVFIDEIDAVGKKRGGGFSGASDEREQTLNQLLVELDGFSENSGVIVLAATNKEEALDKALVRSGRFDCRVHVPKPDLAGRLAILKVHARDYKVSPEVNFLEIAKDTTGMVGADLANILNTSAKLAMKKNKRLIEQSDIREAANKVSMGPERKSMKLSEKEKKMTAYHEAGHTLVGKLIQGCDPVHRVTIIPRGQSLGHTKFLPEEDRNSHSKSYLEAMVLTLVGGRVAEEIIFGEQEVTTGASSDFQKVTNIIEAMVYEFGFSDLGMVVYKKKTDILGNQSYSGISSVNREKLENEVKTRIAKAYAEVHVLLKANEAKLHALAKALLEKETLHGKEIDDAIKSAP